ncbi:MAG: hypothetical protein B7Z66_05095 [Chromatiales bacterium 21-64-14]|nr:MAG: hypothetical protein B7Z66_05095 [Chromatiales bacterium 21-64-14]HQU16479.1 hypothetical protein [Gammaproteobacteria bacterium]
MAVDSFNLAKSASLQHVEPLRKRVPLHDEHGRALADFMMIIPGLRNKPQRIIQRCVKEIQAVCARFDDAVVFVELNVKLNLLWVSHRPTPGVCAEITGALQERIPEALLVGWLAR